MASMWLHKQWVGQGLLPLRHCASSAAHLAVQGSLGNALVMGGEFRVCGRMVYMLLSQQCMRAAWYCACSSPGRARRPAALVMLSFMMLPPMSLQPQCMRAAARSGPIFTQDACTARHSSACWMLRKLRIASPPALHEGGRALRPHLHPGRLDLALLRCVLGSSNTLWIPFPGLP